MKAAAAQQATTKPTRRQQAAKPKSAVQRLIDQRKDAPQSVVIAAVASHSVLYY